VHDHVRGMSPWPGAFTTARRRPLKVHATRILPTGSSGADEPSSAKRSGSSPGQVVLADKSRVLIACGDGGIVELLTVQPEGKRAMRASEWAIGRGTAEGDTLGS
jgi:methionyl-tRNA formyltransferase